MIRRLIPAIAVLAFAFPALAADKVDFKKLKGTWEREVNENKISFEFKDEKKLICLLKPAGADNAIEFTCEYSVDKDGKLSGEIKSVDKKGSDAQVPEAGTKFAFKLEVGEKKFTVSDAEVPEGAKGLVEGEYSKK